MLGLAAWGWWEFPRFQVALGAALLLYLVLLLVFRHAWLVAIPALLPVLDLAPWTGRFYFDESDLFLLVTLGAALLHRRDPQRGPLPGAPGDRARRPVRGDHPDRPAPGPLSPLAAGRQRLRDLLQPLQRPAGGQGLRLGAQLLPAAALDQPPGGRTCRRVSSPPACCSGCWG